MMWNLRTCAAGVAAAAMGACLTIQLPGPSSKGDAGADAGGSSLDGAVGTSADGCPAGPGPAMVLTDTFCVDSTEVTNAQYAQFLSAGWNVSNQPPRCAWNTSFAPGCV